MTKRIDSIIRRPYVIGESFTNPEIVKPITSTREPYWKTQWAMKGPTQVKEELYKSGRLQRFPTVWRRAAKSMSIQKLGAVTNRKELPDFNELGKAPGPTDIKTTTSSTDRGAWGFLDNVIKTAGAVIGQRQQMEIVKAQAQAVQAQQYPTVLPTMFTPTEGGGIGIVTIALITLGSGAALYYFMRK